LHLDRPDRRLAVTRLDILDTRVHNLTLQDVTTCASAWLSAETKAFHHIVTVNPEFIMTARRDEAFREVLASADLATVDGVGIVLAARLFGERVRERVTGVDLTLRLAELEDRSPKIFLLGAGPDIAEQAAEKLRNRNPGVRIVGTWSGSPADHDAPEILRRIREVEADTLLVAFGAPAQDLWLHHHRRTLAAYGIVIGIGVGGTFDYLAGNVPRAPEPIRRTGLEWLYRLIRQPWRWRRQLVLPHFALLVLWERMFRKGNIADVTYVDLEH
jgi:N-acetylglucosaminyldiphosphoundecaprenol N-acetyl-beta-D-mannosaminyltransferase